MFSCVVFVFLMTPHTPNSTRTYTIFPYTTLFRSGHLLKSSSLAPVSPETISTPRIASAQPAPAITTDVRGSARRTPRVPSESRNELVGLAAVGSVIPGRYAHLSCGAGTTWYATVPHPRAGHRSALLDLGEGQIRRGRCPC